ncbi:Sec-independent protein translocase TatA [Kocuria sp. WN036]|uniref:Sec-independent protein translocase subunit TatA n=1 Tax=Kocuria sp. WN036 TaxID=2032628 RepID=UPI000BABB416|nr:Sec-independent protein translocase subunit TatA [Kocuria sp. WN036]PAU90602.1 Sec-independent protein translocase TatA [Kocuria sp. WN036]
MARLFDNPMMLLIVLLVIVLLFGAPRLPGMARSLGQSMRIFKTEVKEMKKDGQHGHKEEAKGEHQITGSHPDGHDRPAHDSSGVSHSASA